MKRNPLLGIGLALVFFSLACQSVPFLAHPTATPTVTPTPTNTPTPTKTNTPTGVPGITMPVTVSGVKILFTYLHEESEIQINGETYKPTNSSDIFIVVEAKVLTSGTSHQDVADWNVSLNNDIEWSVIQSQGDTDSIDSVEWTFIVSKSADEFEINLPGGVDIVLTSLL